MVRCLMLKLAATMTHSNSNAFPPPSAATMTHSNVNNYPPLPQQQIQHPLSTAITNNYNNNNPVTSSSSPFHHLPSDCIHSILHYHIFCLQNGEKWCEDFPYYDIGPDEGSYIYDFGLHGMDNSNWNFLRKFAHCCHFCGDVGLREFLSACRDWNIKPSFFYLHLECISFEELYNNGTVEYLRGISELRVLGEPATFLDPLMSNIRGVKKLEVSNTTSGDFSLASSHSMENLRGLQDISFNSMDFSSLPNDAFQNLRGVKSLSLTNCRFQPSLQIFTHLRGIQSLKMVFCEGFQTPFPSLMDLKNIRGVETFIFITDGVDVSLSDKHLEHFRGVQHLEFRIPSYAGPSLSDNGLKNLRGVRKVVFCGVNCHNVTDSAMINLRGAEKIFLRRFPKLTTAAFQNFRGVKKLTIGECPMIRLKPETLIHLRGVQKLLLLSNTNELVLGNESLNNLCGVRSLEMENVSIVDGGALRYLREVKKLCLSNGQRCRFEIESGLHYLANLEYLHLYRMNVIEMGSFSRVLQLPKLRTLSVSRCIVTEDAIAVFLSKRRRKGASRERLRKDFSLYKMNGKWVMH